MKRVDFIIRSCIETQVADPIESSVNDLIYFRTVGKIKDHSHYQIYYNLNSHLEYRVNSNIDKLSS